MEIDLLFDEKGLGGRKEKLGALFLPLTLIFFFHRPHSLPPSTSNQKKYTKGRATFFGAPDSFAEAYKMDRGEGSFGDFLFGSCGSFNKPRSKQKIDYDDLQLPLDGVAALADVNPDFPGSCGRCYEVRCSEGLLKSNRGDPIWLSEMYYMPQVNSKGKLEEDDGGEGKIEFGFFFFIIIIIIFSSFFLKKEEDSFHFFSSPSLSLSSSFCPPANNQPPIHPSSTIKTVNDTRGRPVPGNPAEKDGHQWVRCWNESSVVVKIVDNCPAVQWKVNHAEPQMWCSADVYHIDLSYWAFEKLAHPVYG